MRGNTYPNALTAKQLDKMIAKGIAIVSKRHGKTIRAITKAITKKP